jgi:hypothetical protein
MVDALALIEEAKELAVSNKSRNIATAAAGVMDAMFAEGIVDLDTSTAYAMVMDELFASGAFHVTPPSEDSPIRLVR